MSVIITIIFLFISIILSIIIRIISFEFTEDKEEDKNQKQVSHINKIAKFFYRKIIVDDTANSTYW